MKISDSKLRETIAVKEFDLAKREKEGDLIQAPCSYYQLKGEIDALKSVLEGKFKVGKTKKP